MARCYSGSWRTPPRPAGLAQAVPASLMLNAAPGICRITQSTGYPRPLVSAHLPTSPRLSDPPDRRPSIPSPFQPSRPALCPATGQTVQFRSCRCPTPSAHAAGQLSDFIRGTVQRGWKPPWNQGVRCNRPIAGYFPRFQVQLDSIGQSATDSKFLYTGMAPHRPLQIPCLVWGDAGVTMPGNHSPTAGAVPNVSRHRQHGVPPRSWPSRSRRWPKRTIAGERRYPTRSLTLGTNLHFYKWHRNGS